MTGGLVPVGRIVGPRGLRGSLKVLSEMKPGDLPGAAGRIFLSPPGGGEVRAVPFTLREIGAWKGGVVLTVEGIGDRTAAEEWTGGDAFVPAADLAPTGRDVYYFAQLQGMTVRNRAGEAVGTVTGIMSTAGHDLLEVTGPGGREWYLPAVKAFIVAVDLDRRTITVDLPDGLVDLNP